jgi:hypothetical protein
VNAGRQLGLDVVTGDPVQKLLLVGHRFVDGVSARRKTLQFADRPAVTIAAIGTPRSENRLRIAEYDQQSQGNLKGPTHHINLRHLLTMSLPVGAIATAAACMCNLMIILQNGGCNAARPARRNDGPVSQPFNEKGRTLSMN